MSRIEEFSDESSSVCSNASDGGGGGEFLPFALVDEPPVLVVEDDIMMNQEEKQQQQQQQQRHEPNCESQQTMNTDIMGSSIASNNTPFQEQESQFIDMNNNNCNNNHDNMEFETAASMLADSPLNGLSTYTTEYQPPTTHQRQQQHQQELGTESMGFTQLMEKADDQHDAFPTARQHLPPLLQSTDKSFQQQQSSATTVATSPSSSINYKSNTSRVSLDFTTTKTIRKPLSRYMKRGIDCERLNDNSFEISMHIYAPSSVKEIMDIVGNPDLLRLWFEPVRALVVTKSSEGARSATNRRDVESRDREYDGEWIEATTTALIDPSQQLSRAHGFCQSVRKMFGFPTFGKITMFVERHRGRVGLTIGPFSGNLTAFHTLVVSETTIQNDNEKSQSDDGTTTIISIVDKVRLDREEEEGQSTSCCCGLSDALERCFLHRLQDHMEQTTASMTRLRVLIENGEVECEAPRFVHEEEEGGVSTQPLI